MHRFLLCLLIAAACGPAAAAGQPGAYEAYWLAEAGASPEYLRLLVCRRPLAALEGQEVRPAAPLDRDAFTFRTYRKDSLWSQPFEPVGRVGRVDAAEKTAEIDGTTYRWEPCPLADVIRLLEKPLGTKPIHRREPPLRGAEQTAGAFRLLLQQQPAAAQPVAPVLRPTASERYRNDLKEIAALVARYVRVREKTGSWPKPGTYRSGALIYKGSEAAAPGFPDRRRDFYRTLFEAGRELDVVLYRDGRIEIEVIEDREPPGTAKQPGAAEPCAAR